jgi:glycosyltransferase involved in cell wall biosynthesis
VREFGDKRFSLFSDGQCLGLQRRLNQLASLARGPYLARMDADDIMHPRRLEVQVDALKADTALDVIGTDAYAIDGNHRLVGAFQSENPSTDPWTVSRKGIFIHPTIMGKTEWFRRNPYSESAHRAEDLELWTRTCGSSKFAVIHEPLLYYRLKPAWSLRPIFASSRTADRIILAEGARIGARWHAIGCVAHRRLGLMLYALYCICGARWIAWHYRRMWRKLTPATASNLICGQETLDRLLRAPSAV